MKKENLYPLLISLTVLLFACDPGLSGDAKIFNDSNTTVTVKYFEYNKNGVADTIVKDLSAGDKLTISVLGGLGDKSKYQCCPYNRVVSIRSPGGPIKKQSIECNSWEIPNKSKLKRFGKEPVKCEFHITPSDI
jgi:hypothetical protein